VLSAAVLALVLRDPPPTEAGVWLTAPPAAGTRVVAPLSLSGSAQAPEGVLRVDLYVVRGDDVTAVASYLPTVPLGPVPFTLRWDPAGAAPGRVTLRVVATSLVRGVSAEAAGLVVPGAPRAVAPPIHRAVVAPAARRAVPAPATLAVPVAVLDDSGRAFGDVAAVLPYAPVPPAPSPAPQSSVVAGAAVPATPAPRGWASFAAGLVALLGSAHVHRALRPRKGPA
jgi:hypothetical protein